MARLTKVLGHQVTARTCLSYDSATCHVASPIFFITERSQNYAYEVSHVADEYVLFYSSGPLRLQPSGTRVARLRRLAVQGTEESLVIAIRSSHLSDSDTCNGGRWRKSKRLRFVNLLRGKLLLLAGGRGERRDRVSRLMGHHISNTGILDTVGSRSRELQNFFKGLKLSVGPQLGLSQPTRSKPICAVSSIMGTQTHHHNQNGQGNGLWVICHQE